MRSDTQKFLHESRLADSYYNDPYIRLTIKYLDSILNVVETALDQHVVEQLKREILQSFFWELDRKTSELLNYQEAVIQSLENFPAITKEYFYG